MKTRMKRVEFYKDEKKEWRWRVVASNGKIIGASTEGYKRFNNCEANFDAMREDPIVIVCIA